MTQPDKLYPDNFIEALAFDLAKKRTTKEGMETERQLKQFYDLIGMKYDPIR
jgi:hypothetical protein